MGIRCVDADSCDYPFLLRQIPDHPVKLYCKGDMSLLKKRCVCMVGSRNMSEYGKRVIGRLFRELVGSEDLVIVSGLALGVDAEVHRLCLKNSLKTIAVVAGDVGSGYPRSNRELYDEISQNGLVVAEYSKCTALEKYMFAKRNRIMVGISDLVIVVESAKKSGSLVTAQLALDYGRDVYVIPGDIDRKTSQGCNMLIKQGAGIIAGVEDFMEILNSRDKQLQFYL